MGGCGLGVARREPAGQGKARQGRVRQRKHKLLGGTTQPKTKTTLLYITRSYRKHAHCHTILILIVILLILLIVILIVILHQPKRKTSAAALEATYCMNTTRQPCRCPPPCVRTPPAHPSNSLTNHPVAPYCIYENNAFLAFSFCACCLRRAISFFFSIGVILERSVGSPLAPPFPATATALFDGLAPLCTARVYSSTRSYSVREGMHLHDF